MNLTGSLKRSHDEFVASSTKQSSHLTAATTNDGKSDEHNPDTSRTSANITSGCSDEALAETDKREKQNANKDILVVHNGRAILVVGDQKRRIQASLRLLEIFCPKLLSIRQDSPDDPTSTGMVTFQVPGEKAEWVHHLCRFLHDCPLAPNVEFGTAYHVARLARKYECVAHVEKPLTLSWFHHQVQYGFAGVPSFAIWYGACAAYWLGDSRWFEVFTDVLAGSGLGSFLRLTRYTREARFALKLACTSQSSLLLIWPHS